jgi:general secretion pathway protein I
MPATAVLRRSRFVFSGSGHQKGFSLLEVLVAFAILSITLGVLLQVFAGGLRNITLSEEYTYAVLHAESLLAAIGSEEPLAEGAEEGEIDGTYFWRLTVTPYLEEELEPDDLDVDAYRVEVEIYWGSDGRRRSIVLETLRLSPREL